MRRIPSKLLLSVLLLLLSACSGQTSTPIVSPPDIPSDQGYSATDPSVPLEVTAGTEFYIAAPSNPSTGYAWQVMNSWNPKIMVMHAAEYQSTAPEGIVGGGGLDIWRFDALSAGDVTFVISSFPPGNTNDPEQTLTFVINIR